LKNIILSVIILSFVFLYSCNENKQSGYVSNDESRISGKKEQNISLEKVNRYLVIKEKEEIDYFIKRHKWDMMSTGTGLRYQIYEKGRGEKVKEGDVITLKYKVYLMTGDLIYSSDSLGLKTFKVGKGGVESGLEEAVLCLNKGDKARLILPSHLAYGLKGDLNRIPKRTPIVYDIQVIDIK
jgi:FKBP-type peptidyl-prolyl cis-trans isomerase